MKKNIIISLICVAVLVVGVIIYLFLCHKEKPIDTTEEGDVEVINNETAGAQEYEFAVKPADLYIVGLWHEAANPLWYKAFYDDYAGDGYFWGKEWQENDSIFEEDLPYHGNGWFRWRREDDKLIEMHVMTMSKVPIAKRWTIKALQCDTINGKTPNQFVDSLIFTEIEFSKNCFRFSRVPE